MGFGKFGKFSVLTVLVMFMMSLVAGCGGGKDGGQAADDKKFLNIGTGGTAGTYYPLGGAMAEILNKTIPGMNASAQSTGATVANINMLKEGSIDMAIVQNDITYYAANGTEMFKDKKIDSLRAIAALYPETVQIVTLEKNNIQSIQDFKGKRIAVGAAGSGAEANARQILEVYGITYNDIDAQYLSFGEAASALKDGNVDAAFLTAGYPTAAVQDIASQNQVKLVPIDADKAEALVAKYPFYTRVTVPGNVYAGLTEETSTVAVKAILVVTDKIDEQYGYDITKAIFTNLERLQASHTVGKMITTESAVEGLPIDLNAGAQKFFYGK